MLAERFAAAPQIWPETDPPAYNAYILRNPAALSREPSTFEMAPVELDRILSVVHVTFIGNNDIVRLAELKYRLAASALSPMMRCHQHCCIAQSIFKRVPLKQIEPTCSFKVTQKQNSQTIAVHMENHTQVVFVLVCWLAPTAVLDAAIPKVAGRGASGLKTLGGREPNRLSIAAASNRCAVSGARPRRSKSCRSCSVT